MPKLHTSANFSPYLPVNAQENLRSYVYRGEDRSVIYQRGWKPLCRKLCPYLPYWLAPNVITVAALAFVTFNHIALARYLPNFKAEVDLYGECPSWVFLAAGVGLLLYQLLDNMDGHQARRLGVSSPLGLLMDHGCDAFNCIIGSLSLCAGIGLGNSWKTWWMFLCTVIAFFMNTWEEYYRGELILPQINGPNEGILIGVGLYITSAIYGLSFWTSNFVTIPTALLPWFLQQEFVSGNLMTIARHTHIMRLGYLLSREPQAYVGDFISAIYSPATGAGTTHEITRYPLFGLTAERFAPQHTSDPVFPELESNGNLEFAFNTIVVLLLCIGTILTALGNIYQVAVAVRRQEEEHRHGRYHKGWLITKFPFIHALTRLLPLTVVTIISGMWTAASPDRIFQQHPRLFCWTVGMLFTKSAIHLMIAHLCSVEFHPFRRTLVPFFYVLGHMAFSFYRNHSIPHIDEGVTLFEFFMLSAISFAHLAVNVIDEMSDLLDVPVFTVPKEKQRMARELENANYFVSSPVHDAQYSKVQFELKRLSQAVAHQIAQGEESLVPAALRRTISPPNQRGSGGAPKSEDSVRDSMPSPQARKPSTRISSGKAGKSKQTHKKAQL